jgi:phosphate/sulfate permease
MGITTGQVQWKPVMGIFAAWVITLPCAALFAGIAYLVLPFIIALAR